MRRFLFILLIACGGTNASAFPRYKAVIAASEINDLTLVVGVTEDDKLDGYEVASATATDATHVQLTYKDMPVTLRPPLKSFDDTASAITCGVGETGDIACFRSWVFASLLTHTADIELKTVPNSAPLKSWDIFDTATTGPTICGLNSDGSATCLQNASGSLATLVPAGSGFVDLANCDVYPPKACGVRPDGGVTCPTGVYPKSTAPVEHLVQAHHGCYAILKDDKTKAVPYSLNTDGQAVVSADTQAAVRNALNETLQFCMVNGGQLACEGLWPAGTAPVPAPKLTQLSLTKFTVCGLTEAGRPRCWNQRAQEIRFR